MQLDIKAWKYIFEIRYPASAVFFDKRGSIIEKFKSEPFLHWKIARNRIDLYDVKDIAEQSISVFAGHKNAGATTEDPPTYTYFRDHLQRWLRVITSDIGVNKLERMGLRTIYLVQIDNMSFQQLFKSFINSYLIVNKELWGLETAKANDVCIQLDLMIDTDKMHMITGPMEKEQAKGYFERNEVKEKLPSLAIFADLDYSSENPSFDESKMLQAIMGFVSRARENMESHLQQFLMKFSEQGE